MSTEPKISPEITRQQVILFNRILKLGLQFPFAALEAVVDTLEEGKDGKYKDDPFIWRRQEASKHESHANRHIYEWYHHVTSDEHHAAHAITRWLMWYETIPHPENERPAYTGGDDNDYFYKGDEESKPRPPQFSKSDSVAKPFVDKLDELKGAGYTAQELERDFNDELVKKTAAGNDDW